LLFPFEPEELFDVYFQRLRNAKRQNERRRVLAAFDVSDGLIVDADRVGEILAAKARLGPHSLDLIADETFFFTRLSSHGCSIITM
jgi:thiamine monophosphate kinase